MAPDLYKKVHIRILDILYSVRNSFDFLLFTKIFFSSSRGLKILGKILCVCKEFGNFGAKTGVCCCVEQIYRDKTSFMV